MCYSEKFTKTAEELNIKKDDKFLNYVLWLILNAEQNQWLKTYKRPHITLNKFHKKWLEYKEKNNQKIIQFLPLIVLKKIEALNLNDKVLEIQKKRITFISEMILDDFPTLEISELQIRQSYFMDNINWYKRRTMLV